MVLQQDISRTRSPILTRSHGQPIFQGRKLDFMARLEPVAFSSTARFNPGPPSSILSRQTRSCTTALYPCSWWARREFLLMEVVVSSYHCLVFVGLQNAQYLLLSLFKFLQMVLSEIGVEYMYCTKCFCITRILSNMISWLIKYKTRDIIIPTFEATVWWQRWQEFIFLLLIGQESHFARNCTWETPLWTCFITSKQLSQHDSR